MAVVNYDQFQQPFMLTSAGYGINKPGLDNAFKKTQLPYIGETDLSRWVTDADMRKLERATIKDTYIHRHQCFWRENVALSLCYYTVANILGEGIKITIEENEKAVEIIEEWNDEINVRHETVEDLIADVWADNLIDAQSLWRVFIDDEDEEHKVDLQRVSMSQVRTLIHPTRGWRVFIQKANIPKQYMNKTKFYRNAVPFPIIEMEYVETIIPDELNCCLYFNFFRKAPVSTVLHLMVYKKWITWFMRKFAEKYWAPFLIGYVGDPKTGYMPTTKKDKEDSLQYTANALKRVRDFGVGAFLGTTQIDVLDTKTSKNSDVYTNYLEYINKEISFGLLGSMALKEASGSEKSTSDIIQQGYLRFIRGKRNSIGLRLAKFYSKVLLPAYGIEEISPRKIKIEWPPIRLENIKDILESVEIAAKVGGLRDAREIRKILTPIWAHIDADISDADVKELKNRFMEINSPSRAEGDSPQGRAGTSAKGTGSSKAKPKAKS